MKFLKWGVLAVVVLVVAALLIGWINLNGIVRRTVETQGTKQLDVKTTLGGASVSLFGGSLGLKDLEIASPPGYAAPQMLSLGKGHVAVSYGQLRQQPVHVQTIELNAPKLVIEQSGGKFNFQALMDRSSSAEPKPEGGEPMRLIIDSLRIDGAVVSLRPGLPTFPEQYDVRIPTVELQNVGTGEGAQNGAALKEVVMQVITAMAAQAANSDRLPPEVRALLAGDLKQVAGKLANEQLKRLTDQVQKKLPGEAGQMVGDILKNPQQATSNPSQTVEKGLGGLLEQTQKKKK